MCLYPYSKTIFTGECKMICINSGKKQIVSDEVVMDKRCICRECGQYVKITIPDKRMHGNTAKFAKHSVLKAVLDDKTVVPDTMFRLAIEEVEAWYFGDREALLAAYPRVRQDVMRSYVQDSVCDTWELLADAVYPGGSSAIKKAGWPLPGQVKHEWAKKIAPLMEPDRNVSPSFCKFRDGLRQLCMEG